MPSPPDKARVDVPPEAPKPPQDKQGSSVWPRTWGCEGEHAGRGSAPGECASRGASVGRPWLQGPQQAQRRKGGTGEGRAAGHTPWEANREQDVHAETAVAGKRKRASSARLPAPRGRRRV